MLLDDGIGRHTHLCIGYWIHKSAICAHILHEFVVLPEAQPSAKKHKRVQYTGAWGTSMYPVSDLLHLLHLRNAILIGKQKNSPRQFCVKLVKPLVQKRAIYCTPIEQSD